MPVLTSIRTQRGAAGLIVTMMLFFVMVLVALFVNRNLVFEQRSSANQYRSTQAFEAAEAGIEWAQAQLNANQRIGADCEPSPDLAASSFRSRYLSIDPVTAAIKPTTWVQGGVATPLQPTCVRTGSGWSCNCPSAGLSALNAPSGNMPAPAFVLQFLSVGQPGLVRVSATGCNNLDGACRPGSTSTADAAAHIDVLLGLAPGLRTPPAAALTTRGKLDAGNAAVGLHNVDPSTGLAVHAGGSVVAPNARWSGPAGASLSSALAANDAALAALTSDHFFARHFGLDKTAWRNHPSVKLIHCSGDCSDAVSNAVAASADAALLWVDGDLTLVGPLVLGSLLKPVLIVASGDVRINGAVALHGLVYGSALKWSSATSGAFVRGAVLIEGDYNGDGTPDLAYDDEVLARLSRATGSLVRVSGSWHDF